MARIGPVHIVDVVGAFKLKRKLDQARDEIETLKEGPAIVGNLGMQIVKLEKENRHLRAELERLKRKGR